MFLISYSGFVHIVEKYIKDLYGGQWLLLCPQVLVPFLGGFSPANKRFGRSVIDF